MQIEKTFLNTTLYHVNLDSTKIREQKEIGRYRIQSIQDCGQALHVDLLDINSGELLDSIKIYINKSKFQNSFAEGDDIIRYRNIPERIKYYEIEGMEWDNTVDFFVNLRTGEKSDLFYPWDPYS